MTAFNVTGMNNSTRLSFGQMSMLPICVTERLKLNPFKLTVFHLAINTASSSIVEFVAIRLATWHTVLVWELTNSVISVVVQYIAPEF